MGVFLCGFLVAFLRDTRSWTVVNAYRVVFIAYALLGMVKLVLAFMLSEAIELEKVSSDYQEDVELENEGLLSEDPTEHGGESIPAKPRTRSQPRRILSRVTSLMPTISPGSKAILAKLICLFAVDSFASGLASPSWMTYFFTTVHHLPTQALGTLFLVTNLLATVSNLLALPIARRIGPLKAMTFTHLPSAIFLGSIPLPPVTTTGTWLAMGLLALRACTQSMDQAPRQAFLGAMLLPAERTAVLGVVNIGKTLAQAGGIGTTGVLAGAKSWIVILSGAGALKASYDLAMLWMFLGMKDREDNGHSTRT